MDSSNLMENFTILDEYEGSDFDSDPDVDASNCDVTQVQPEHDTDMRFEQEFMPNQESEKPPETETLDPAIHPYAHLIQSFQFQKEQVEVFDVGTVKELDETTFEIIMTQEALMEMIEELKNQREISLVPQIVGMQKLIALTIGTIEKQYVIDTVKLSTSLVALTAIFINSKIVKIVHKFDLLKGLLHNPYHLYLVNVFTVQPAYFLKEKKDIGLNTLICQEYGCEKFRVTMRMILDDLENPLVIIDLRKQAHFLFYLYHDIKNYLLVSDEEGYMNLLEKMQKGSMSLKFDKKQLLLEPIRKQFLQEYQCQLDVLQKVDDWRFARFGEDFAGRGLPKEHLIVIAKELPQTITALRHLINVKLPVDQINEILDIVKYCRRMHTLPVYADKKNEHANIEPLECTQQQSNNIQGNKQINPQKVSTPRKNQNKTLRCVQRNQRGQRRSDRYRITMLSKLMKNVQDSIKSLKPNNMNNERSSVGRWNAPICNRMNSTMFSPAASSTAVAQNPGNYSNVNAIIMSRR